MGAYDKDFYGWAIEQAALLREGRLGEIDVAHVAEEIEDLGRGEKRELTSRLTVLLSHLLKWQLQPDRRGRSWRLTIAEQRDSVLDHLDDNPSLRGQLPEILARAWRAGLRGVQSETDLDLDAFPRANPWTIEQILDEEFFPE
jgi:hypothetical protein